MRKDYGYVMKVSDTSYRILANPKAYDSGMIIDKADIIEKIKAYVEANPDKVFTEWKDTRHDKVVMLKKLEKAENELSTTDYAVVKFMDKYIQNDSDLLESFNNEYPDLLAKRQEARDMVNEIRNELSTY